MSESDAPAADWYPDPSGRFQFRYWDGEAWTGHVSTEGRTDWDPPGEAAPEEEGTAAGEHDAAEPAPGGGVAAVADDQGGDDSAWAPQDAGEQSGAQSGDAARQPVAEPRGQVAGEDAAPSDGAIDGDEPDDANMVANRRAGLPGDVRAWLDEVAAQVDPRLSRITREWTAQPQAEAARACAYGLLLGHLARLHPHMRPELTQVAEAHPSFTTLEAGARLETLEQIASDPERAAAWLGPLIGAEDVDRVKMLFD